MRNSFNSVPALSLAVGLLVSTNVRAVEILGSTSWVVVSDASALATADFNGDGVQDFAVAKYTGAIEVFLGDAVGDFDRTEFSVLGHPTVLAVADFNADGAIDLAVGGEAAPLAILPGDHQGGFGPPSFVDSPVSALCIGDLNSDGIPDLAVVRTSDGITEFLIGRGDGVFDPHIVGVRPGAASVGAGDFNGDGFVDVAIGHEYWSTPVHVLFGDGTGSVSSEVDEPCAGKNLIAGDFNTDGVSDLVVTDGDTLRVLLSDGTGGMHPPGQLPVRRYDSVVTAADLDGDGTLDLASSSGEIFLGDGEGQFALTATLASSWDGPQVIADFNMDGAQDLAFLLAHARVFVLPGDGRGGFREAQRRAVPATWHSVTAGDLDGDGLADVAVTSGTAVRILRGQPDGVLDDGGEIELGASPSAIAVGDLDGDGTADVVTANAQSDSVSVVLGTGQGEFGGARLIPVGDSPGSLALGDVNGDGARDIVVANFYSNDVTVLLGDGRGEFVALPPFGVGEFPCFVTTADFNRDGRLDLAIVRTEDAGGGAVAIFLGDGAGGFYRSAETPANTTISAAVGDFNGDGAADIVVGTEVSATLRLIVGDGHGGFAAESVFELGGTPWAVASQDFNDDALTDVVAIGPDKLDLMLGDGRGGFTLAADALEVGTSLAIGDFNGDSRPDVALSNSYSDTISIVLNRGLDRADTNGSNRIDGFDVAHIARLAGSRRCPDATQPCDSVYRRSADVNLDGIIDGDDLAVVAERFGRLRETVAPLRGVVTQVSPGSRSVFLRQVASDADHIELEVATSAIDMPSAAASFGIRFEDTDNSPSQLLEIIGFRPGTFFSGSTVQICDVDVRTPGVAKVSITRFPDVDRPALGDLPIISLVLRPRRVGSARLEFEPLDSPHPALLAADGTELPITFVGGNALDVSTSGGSASGQRISVAPAIMSFAPVDVGSEGRHSLRVENLGITDLSVSSVSASGPPFRSYATSAFSVPPFGLVEVPVSFAPVQKGRFVSDLTVLSDDPDRPEVVVPLVGNADSSLAVSPASLDFGIATRPQFLRRLTVRNVSDDTITLVGVATTDGRFVVEYSFTELAPGSAGSLTVTFTPTSTETVRSVLSLSLGPVDETVSIEMTVTAPQGDR